ncbi:MAG TPA: hypothetical protein VGN16_03110 [Acidobacteriaceae bacterium]
MPHSVAVGGPEDLERINGRVIDGLPGAQVVLYARSEGTWWIQPFRSRAFTQIERDGSWSNLTHLGTDYAALLVTAGYQSPAKISDLPPLDNNVLAVATTPGSSSKPATAPTLHFSGYDWKVRSGPGDADGEPCDYEASNAWVDDRGYLHLWMGEETDRYLCAGVSLTRSLGYGTYRFVVSDSTHLPPSAVFSMLVRPDREDPDDRSGFAIQRSAWGKPDALNADFVVQPYYIPGNTARFTVPAGDTTYLLRWEPGSAVFNSAVGSSGKTRGNLINQAFRSGVPIPSKETVKLDFHDFHHSKGGVHHPVEIVVQKFEYLP